MEEIETSFTTIDDMRIYLSNFDEGGAWIRLSMNHASMHTALTRDEAEQLLAGLQAILGKEVTA